MPRYEGATHDSNAPHKKSAGQFGDSSEKTTTDPNQTEERLQGKDTKAETRQQQAEVDALKSKPGDEGLAGRTDVGGQKSTN